MRPFSSGIEFLHPTAFLDALGARVDRLDGSSLETEQLLGTADQPTVALLAAPASS